MNKVLDNWNKLDYRWKHLDLWMHVENNCVEIRLNMTY